MKARFTGSQKGRENESQETGGDEKKRKKRQVVMGAECAQQIVFYMMQLHFILKLKVVRHKSISTGAGDGCKKCRFCTTLLTS